MSLKTPSILALNYQQGFTLLEVLVAVAILAIGLLGLAGLQASSLRLNNSAYQRSQATNLAYSIIDQMRTNRTAALAGEYDNVNFESSPACTTNFSAPSGNTASQDIATWRNTLACALPSGTGRITRDVVTGVHIFTITAQWADNHGQETRQFQMDTAL